MTKFFTATAAFLAVLAWTATAQAAEMRELRSDAPSEVVKYSESQLTTYSGAQQVYGKIHSAAWRVCSDMFSANNGPDALTRHQCIDTLVDEAVKEVNSPKLTALYDLEEKGQPIRVAESRLGAVG